MSYEELLTADPRQVAIADLEDLTFYQLMQLASKLLEMADNCYLMDNMREGLDYMRAERNVTKQIRIRFITSV